MYEIISLINFISLNVSAILSFYVYTLSIMPVTREQKKGKKAWKESNRLRIIADIIWTLFIANFILWIWFPVKSLNWPISQDYIFLFIISIILMVPFLIITFKAVKDAGSETVITSEDNEMYGGIYNYIRHPQMLGASPLILLICCLLNSIILLTWFSILIVIIVPIVIHFEEKDLLMRFGDSYKEYQARTGAIIPKFWRKK